MPSCSRLAAGQHEPAQIVLAPAALRKDSAHVKCKNLPRRLASRLPAHGRRRGGDFSIGRLCSARAGCERPGTPEPAVGPARDHAAHDRADSARAARARRAAGGQDRANAALGLPRCSIGPRQRHRQEHPGPAHRRRGALCAQHQIPGTTQVAHRRIAGAGSIALDHQRGPGGRLGEPAQPTARLSGDIDRCRVGQPEQPGRNPCPGWQLWRKPWSTVASP